jgi:uncharacterized protein with beta-barrel porin domain
MVIAGTLMVDSSMSTSPLTTVNAGGTLAGVGFVGNTQVSGGTPTPGSLSGPLTVQGNLAFTAASTYMIRCRQPMPAATVGGATVNAIFPSR